MEASARQGVRLGLALVDGLGMRAPRDLADGDFYFWAYENGMYAEAETTGDGGRFVARRLRLNPGACGSIGDFDRWLSAEMRCDPGTGATAEESFSSCEAWMEDGARMRSCEELVRQPRVWVVPPARPFMYAPRYVGFTLELRRVGGGSGRMSLETLSTSPAVFRLRNFFSTREASQLVAAAMGQKDEQRRLQRSTTGVTGQKRVVETRTSENAFDTSSKLARRLKRRGFDLLGLHSYDERMADGIQILRYNLTQAYVPHHDYMDDTRDGFNWQPSTGGSNRFATIFLYLSDVARGGETVFVKAPPLPEFAASAPASLEASIRDLRESAEGKLFDRGSWQERLVGQCQTQLAVRPAKGDALLFYNQMPSGRQDRAVLHGGCPVLEGTKWAANLWVWNRPRYGMVPAKKGAGAAAERDGAAAGDGGDGRSFEIRNAGVADALRVFWIAPDGESHSMGEVEPGATRRWNSFVGHVWEVTGPEGGTTRYTIEPSPVSQGLTWQ